MPGQPASRNREPSSDPAPEAPAGDARLDDFLEYRARAVRRRRVRWRVAVGALASTGVLLVVVVIVTDGGRLLRARMARRPIALPLIALPEASAPPASPATTNPEPPPAAAPSPPAIRDQRAAPADAPPPGTPTPPTGSDEHRVITPDGSAPVTPSPATGNDRHPPPTPERTAPSGGPSARLTDERRERLALLRPGDTKERVFDLFGTTFERQAGSVVRIDGMRLRARGHSPRYAQIEVADVKLRDGVYWFVFGDGRLVAWGRRADWRGIAQRHQFEVDYPP